MAETLKQLRAKLATLIANHDALVEEYKQSVRDYNQRVGVYNENLKAWKEASSQFNADVDSFNAKRAIFLEDRKRWSQKVDQFNVDIKSLNREFEAFKVRVSQYQNDVHSLNNKIRYYNEIRNDPDVSESEKARLRNEIASERNRLNALEEQLSREKAHFTGRYSEMDRRRQALQSESQALDRREADLIAERDGLKTRQADLEKGAAALSAEEDGIKADKQKIEAIEKQLTDLIAEIREVEKKIKAIEEMPKYKLKDATIILSGEIRAVIASIAEAFFAETNKILVVTSGTRTALTQASALYVKLKAGQDIVKLYRNKVAAKEIADAYKDHETESRSSVVEAMRAVIQAQIDRGVFISKHLRAGAADIRSHGMTLAQKALFRQIVARNTNLYLIEEGTPPHFHLHFKVMPSLAEIRALSTRRWGIGVFQPAALPTLDEVGHREVARL